MVKSNITGAIGIRQSATSEAEGSFAESNTVECVNGTAFDLIEGRNNRDVLNPSVFNKEISRSGNVYNEFSVNLTSTSGVVCSLADINTDTSNYSGTLHITAKPTDSGSTETSSYFLNVVKKASGPDGELAVISELGLITGGGTSHPSFTWTIDASNNLIATVIASTEPNRTWFFWISSQGDLRTD